MSDGKWGLSEETPLPSVTEAHGGHPLVHLSWNETGSEMAVVDYLGRVSIYSISLALNSITGVRQVHYDSGDDSNQIVGMMWLNTQRMVSLSFPHINVPPTPNTPTSYMLFIKQPRSTADGHTRHFVDAQLAPFTLPIRMR